VENDNFVLTLKHRSFFSSSKECQISKDSTIVEYEPVDARLLVATVVWDVIAIFAMLFHLKFVPNYVWLCGIFGLPILTMLWGLIRRKRYFKIKVDDQ
jgi:fatty acid desaturase